MSLADESIRYEIKLKDSKNDRRTAITDFLLPLHDDLQDRINEFAYLFEPHLQLDIRVDDVNLGDVQDDVAEQIEDAQFLGDYEFIPEPYRAWWGETDRDEEALIRGHELSAELALTIVDIKDAETEGRSIDEHASRRLHLFLNQMGLGGRDEFDVYLSQLVGRHPAVSEEDVEEAAGDVVDVLNGWK